MEQVLLLHPLQGEASEQVVAGLVDNFTEAQLKQVRHVAYDSPSEKLYGEMLGICPNMQSLMLDPVHIAIVYEYGFWNKRNAGSKQLRRILQKFNCFGQNMAAGQLGSYYNGSMSRPLQMQENKYREMILDFSMEDHEVDATLTGLQPNVTFCRSCGVHQMYRSLMCQIQARGEPQCSWTKQGNLQDTLVSMLA